MVKGTVSMVGSYKSTPDVKMVIEVREPDKLNAMALDKRDVVIIGATEFVKFADAIPETILEGFITTPLTETKDDFGKEE